MRIFKSSTFWWALLGFAILFLATQIAWWLFGDPYAPFMGVIAGGALVSACLTNARKYQEQATSDLDGNSSNGKQLQP